MSERDYLVLLLVLLVRVVLQSFFVWVWVVPGLSREALCALQARGTSKAVVGSASL